MPHPRCFKAKCRNRVGIVDLDSAVEIVVLNYNDGPLFAARPL